MARTAGVAVGGTFWDQPAGQFQWQGVATDDNGSGKAARSAPTTFEPDRSRGR